MRALVINTAYLGDLVFTLPLIESLGAAGYEVDLLARPRIGVIAEGTPGLGEVLTFDKRGADRGLRGLRRVGRQLRERRYDRVLGAHPSVRSGLLARQSRAPVRVGWGPVGYTQRVPRGRTFVHDALQLAVALGVSPVVTTPKVRCRAPGPAVPPGTIALAPGSQRVTKQWPHFGALAQRLVAAGRTVIWLGLESERGLAPRIGLDGFGLSLPATAATLERCAALVGNDSGLTHVARGVGTRTVALFGPTSADRLPEDAGRLDLSVSGLACRPCSPNGPRRCPKGHHRCLKDLGEGMVQAELEREE